MNKLTSIGLLNQAVADELQAVHQYMYFHFHLDDQGFGPLSMLFKRIAIVEMGDVQLLAERDLVPERRRRNGGGGPGRKNHRPRGNPRQGDVHGRGERAGLQCRGARVR